MTYFVSSWTQNHKSVNLCCIVSAHGTHSILPSSKTQEYFSVSPAENLQAPVLPEEALWHQKACFVDSSRINFGSIQENPELMIKLALEKIATKV